MKNTAQRIFCLLLVLIPMLLTVSCTDMPTAGLVQLKSKSEPKQYAAENCPACTFVRFEKGKHRNTCYFIDDKCGFEFTISSYAYYSGSSTAPGGYLETTENSWRKSYYDYILDTIKESADTIAAQAGFTIEKEDDYPNRVFAILRTDRTLEQISDGMIQLGKLIKSKDVYHEYDNCELWAKPPTGGDSWEEFAFYRFKDDVTADFDDWGIYYFMDNAEEQLGVKCTFDHMEEIKEGEIPGLSSWWEYYDPADADRVFKVYFFTTETGEKKLIANYQVDQNVYYIADAD